MVVTLEPLSPNTRFRVVTLRAAQHLPWHPYSRDMLGRVPWTVPARYYSLVLLGVSLLSSLCSLRSPLFSPSGMDAVLWLHCASCSLANCCGRGLGLSHHESPRHAVPHHFLFGVFATADRACRAAVTTEGGGFKGREAQGSQEKRTLAPSCLPPNVRRGAAGRLKNSR